MKKNLFLLAMFVLLILPLSGCKSDQTQAHLSSGDLTYQSGDVKSLTDVVNRIFQNHVVKVGNTTKIDFKLVKEDELTVPNKFLEYYKDIRIDTIPKEEQVSTLLNVYHTFLFIELNNLQKEGKNTIDNDFYENKYADVLGRKYNLKDLESLILSTSKDSNIFFLISKGTIGGPDFPTELFTSKDLKQKQDFATSNFINHIRSVEVMQNGSRIKVSKLYKDYEKIFKENNSSIKQFILPHLANKDVKTQLERFTGVLEYDYNNQINSL